MSSCEGQLEVLSAFLDGELGPKEELELRRHVDACDTCRAWHAQLEALSTGIANSIGRERAPRGLVYRVRRFHASSWRVRAAGATAAAAALLAAWGLLGPTLESNGSAFRLVEDHLRFVSGETALAFPFSDPGAVARGLAATLPFRVTIAEVEGARLLGGQDCSLPEGPAAYLQYEREGESVSVFVAPHLTPVPGAEPCQTVAGATLCTFTGPRETVAVVASRPETAQIFRRAVWIVGSP